MREAFYEVQEVPLEGSVSRRILSRVNMGWYFGCLWILSMSIQVWLGSRFRGFVGDQMMFISWMRDIQQVGLADMYKTVQVDYPPVYLIVLDAYGRMADLMHISIAPGELWAKIPGIAIYGAAMIAFFFVSRAVSKGWRMFVLLLFCLNPAIQFDTAVWGQVDVLDSILVVLAVVLLRKRLGVAGGVLSLSLLAKFQSIVVLPIVVAYAVRETIRTRHFRKPLALLLGSAIPFVLVGSVLAMNGAFFDMLYKAYIATTGEYPVLDMNAMNIWYYLFGTSPQLQDGTIIVAGISFKTLGLTLMFFMVVYSMYYLWHTRVQMQQALVKSSTLLAFSFFMLPTEIHERYILMALVLCITVTLVDRTWTLLAVGMTLTAFFNIWTVCYGRVNPTSDMWMVYLNGVMLVAMVVMTHKEIGHPRSWKAVLQPSPSA